MSARSHIPPGTMYGRLTVIEVLYGGGAPRCRVFCPCGTEKTTRLADLRSGRVKSCGCLRNEAVARACATHGNSGTPAYSAWWNMHSRTSDPNNPEWPNYGERGIAVCLEWQDFDVFLSDMGQPPNGMQLERQDNNLGYSKSNCLWVTPTQNSRNKRNNVLVSFNGREVCIAEAAELTGVSHKALRARHAQGQTGPELFRPSQRNFTKENHEK